MKQNVNYILHHRLVNIKMCEDKQLKSTHVSLYNALFLIWNECGFDTELSINRNDVMKLSKIGSANTYTKALKELDNLGYIKYKPSYNPLIGSIVNLYRFDKGTDNSTDKGSVKSSSKGTDKGCDTLSKQLNKETIKQLNKVYTKDVHDCLEDCLKFFPENLHPKTDNQINNWLDTIEKLIRIDKIPFVVIRELVEKVRADDFWSKNFLSITKLRKKNKDDIMYVVAFNEQFKNNSHEESKYSVIERIKEQYPDI